MKKILASLGLLLALVPSTAFGATDFMESGSDATQGLEFYSATSGTVASASDRSHTGPRSIKLSTGSPAVAAEIQRASIMNDAGRRVSFWVNVSGAPSGNGSMVRFLDSGGGTNFTLGLNPNLTLQNLPNGTSGVNGTHPITANNWTRVSIAYFITGPTVFTYQVWVNGILDSTFSSGTLSNTSSNRLVLRDNNAFGTNFNVWYDDIYVDDQASSGSLTDVGDVRVTAKRPFANGTTNGFASSGTPTNGVGTGNAPYVSQEPLSTSALVSKVGAGAAVTEEYNAQNLATGDVNLNGQTLVDIGGWLYSSSLSGETAQLVLKGANTAISLTSSNTLFTAFAGSSAYPAGTGTDIGEITSTALTTVSLYEAGILVAYKPVFFGLWPFMDF